MHWSSESSRYLLFRFESANEEIAGKQPAYFRFTGSLVSLTLVTGKWSQCTGPVNPVDAYCSSLFPLHWFTGFTGSLALVH